jgi:outer membrane protein
VKRFLIAGAALLAAACAGLAQETGPVLTLQQCIDAALADGVDNRLLQTQLEVSRQQFAATAAQNAYSLRATLGYSDSGLLGDPQLSGEISSSSASAGPVGPEAGLTLSGPLTSLSLTAYPFFPPTGPEAAKSGAASLSLNQTLWDGYPGGTARANVDKGRLALRGSELSVQASRLNLVYQIKQAYFTMLTAQDNVSLQQDILQRQESLLRQIQAVYNLQQASEADLKTAQVNARTAQVDLDGYRHDLRLAGVRLANLMGRSPGEPYSVAAVEAPQPPGQSLQQAVADGLARRTDIQQLELNRRSTAVDLTLARGLRQPSVGVTAGIDGLAGWSGKVGWLASTGLKLGIPVLDSGASRSLQQAARLQDQLYAQQEQQLRLSIAADIEDAYGSLQVALERVEAAQGNAEALELQFEMKQVQNKFGTATTLDLLTAAVDAGTARTALARAKSDAQLAALKLQNVMGY